VEETLGGYSAVARYLTGRSDRAVTRQQVYSWYQSRHVNGFPEAASHLVCRRKGKQVSIPQFSLETAGTWHDQYIPQPGRPRKGK
jgi:hypothetical protein